MKCYRIFLILGGKASPIDKSQMWVKNLFDPLVALGHDVYLVNIDDYAEKHQLGYMTLDSKERLSNELPDIFLKEHSKQNFDICFSYLHNAQIIPSVLKEIKKHTYTINYSTNFHQFEMYKEIATYVDYNIYISKIAKSGFDGIGVKSYWMPLAANSSFYKPSQVKNSDTVFIGSVYGARPYLFWRLLQYGTNLHMYGQGWKEDRKTVAYRRTSNIKVIQNYVERFTGLEIRKKKPFHSTQQLEDVLRGQYDALNASVLSLIRRDYPHHIHGSLDDEQYVQTLAQAGSVVNIQESRFNHDFFNHQVLFGTNLRDYEATMCGSFVYSQYSDEMEELFEIGKEIICYHNEHDLVEKIKYYDQHQEDKQRIAKAGYNRSINSHTWKNRFSDFFTSLNL
jgi:spore maturation protein CgeB